MDNSTTSSHPAEPSSSPDFTLEDAQNLPWPIQHLDEVDDFGPGALLSQTTPHDEPPVVQRELLGRVVDASADQPSFDTDYFRLKNRVATLEADQAIMRIVLAAVSFTFAIVMVLMLILGVWT